MSTEQKFSKKLPVWVKLLMLVIASSAVLYIYVGGKVVININSTYNEQIIGDRHIGTGTIKNGGNNPANGTAEFKSDGYNDIKSLDITAGDEYIRQKYKSTDGKYIIEFGGVPPGGAIQMKTASDSVVTVTVIDLKENPKDKKFFARLKKFFGY